MNKASSKEYIYSRRSCLYCKRYPCFQGQETTESDFAKYGCLKYIGKYQKEKAKPKQNANLKQFKTNNYDTRKRR